MPYKLSVIWLRHVPLRSCGRAAPHWSLYLHHTSTRVGDLHEAALNEFHGWYYNHETAVDPRQTRKDDFRGELVLGEIADKNVPRFEIVAKEMVLPMGGNETCQDWVKAVVSEVVDEMLLPSVAIKKVELIHR
jgi:hypothetical protein